MPKPDWKDDGHVLVLTVGHERVDAMITCTNRGTCQAYISCQKCEGFGGQCDRCGGSGNEPTVSECWLRDHAPLYEESHIMASYRGIPGLQLYSGQLLVWRMLDGENGHFEWKSHAEWLVDHRT